MSQVYTLEQIDDEIIRYMNMLKDPKISIQEKQDLRKKIHYLEEHVNSVNAKLIAQKANKVEGKVYPSLISDHFGYTPEEKEELLKLIDSV